MLSPRTPVQSLEGANTYRRRANNYQTSRSISASFSGTPHSSLFDRRSFSTGSRKRERTEDEGSCFISPSPRDRNLTQMSSPLTRIETTESEPSSSPYVPLGLPPATDEPRSAPFNETTTLESPEQTNQADGVGFTEETENTWGGLVFKLVGGVAGKMWEFCRTSAFGGFTAGGGTSYEITETAPKIIPGSWDRFEQDELDNQGNNENRNVPGASSMGTPERPAKRLQSSSGWVMVGHEPFSTGIERPASPSPSLSRRSYIPRPVYSPSPAQQSRIPTARTPSRSHEVPSRASASYASTRSPEYSPRVPASPSSVDVQKFTAKRRREDYQTDASIWRLNQQLTAMIRQGQEALATKVDVGRVESTEMDAFT